MARSGRISSTTSPTARLTSKVRARRSGGRPKARWTASSARSERAARWRAVAMALKSCNPKVRIAAADPMGAAIYSWIRTGKLESQGSSITEGIGQGRVTANLEGAPIDDAYQIADAEMLPIVFDLLEHEGLCDGRVDRGQRGWRDPSCEGFGPRPYRRYHPRRLRHAVSEARCSIRNSSSPKDCPCRTGSRSRARRSRSRICDEATPSSSTQWLAEHIDAPDL